MQNKNRQPHFVTIHNRSQFEIGSLVLLLLEWYNRYRWTWGVRQWDVCPIPSKLNSVGHFVIEINDQTLKLNTYQEINIWSRNNISWTTGYDVTCWVWNEHWVQNDLGIRNNLGIRNDLGTKRPGYKTTWIYETTGYETTWFRKDLGRKRLGYNIIWVQNDRHLCMQIIFINNNIGLSVKTPFNLFSKDVNYLSNNKYWVLRET